MAISAAEAKAIKKAQQLGWASKVERVQYGVYLVPSASSNEKYVVTGTKMDASDHRCTCQAGLNGRVCFHVEAVRLARLRHEAMRQYRKMQEKQKAGSPAPTILEPARSAQALRRVALL